jgi:hypothetical protein
MTRRTRCPSPSRTAPPPRRTRGPPPAACSTSPRRATCACNTRKWGGGQAARGGVLKNAEPESSWCRARHPLLLLIVSGHWLGRPTHSGLPALGISIFRPQCDGRLHAVPGTSSALPGWGPWVWSSDTGIDLRPWPPGCRRIRAMASLAVLLGPAEMAAPHAPVSRRREPRVLTHALCVCGVPLRSRESPRFRGARHASSPWALCILARNPKP